MLNRTIKSLKSFQDKRFTKEEEQEYMLGDQLFGHPTMHEISLSIAKTLATQEDEKILQKIPVNILVELNNKIKKHLKNFK